MRLNLVIRKMPHKGKSSHRSKTIKKKRKKPSLAQKSTLKQAVKDAISEGKLVPRNKSSKPVKKEKISPDEDNEQKPKVDGKVDPRFRRKHGRVIIRNLPFQVTDENLRKYLEKYGPIEEINILRKPDGKLVGCGFVQFASKKKAGQAITECNAQPFLGRPIIFDWALPKEVFITNYQVTTTKVSKDDPKDEVKVENEDEVEDIKEENEGDDKEDNENGSLSVDESLDENEEEDKPKLLNKKGQAEMRKSFTNQQKPATNYKDEEGCTVFLKNVSFQTTNEELKEFMEKFGPVHYALICKDPLTDHSRGTAFVKFKNKESADKCLSAETEELILDGSSIAVMQALSREEAKRKVDEGKEKGPKDARNLYLAKEGVIIAGTKAAKGVSVNDMAKRLKLEQWKTQILKNLKMFVSRYRLVVQNLPPAYTDKQLKKLFLKHAGPGAIIKEAKVMRDLKNIQSDGLGKSREYAFISFTKHEHALAALRNINNNPDIFKPDKRPIVAFSIENKDILNAKQKRLQKSQAMNPLFQQKQKSLGDESKTGGKGKGRRAAMGSSQNTDSEELPSYGGLTSKPGPTKLRAKHKLKDQLQLHVSKIKQDKKKKKVLQQLPKLRKVSDSHGQASKEKNLKRKSNVEDASFLKLVNKYKTKLASVPQK
ncbi:hypothetical protein J437_LFUL000005, partial [Ladona fulva]